MTVLDILVVVFAMATIGAYIWSARFHFNTSDLGTVGKLIPPLVIVSGVSFTWATLALEQNIWIQMLGFVLILVSFTVFWLAIRETRQAKLVAAFTDTAPTSLVTTGPYRYVRHPFYTSYVLFWLGFALSAGTVWALALFGVLFIVYWSAARDEEERFANTDMAEEYATFKKTRGRFFPKLN